jgi:flagellar basal body rod protein FlgG
MFWDNSNATPEQLSVALGNDAKQLFQLHYQLGQLISTVNPADIAIGASVIGQFTMNEDGTVTILPPSGNP